MMARLFRDTLIYGVAGIFSRSLSILILPIYTRILSPADYGALDMIFVLLTFASLLVALEITQALARFYGDSESESDRQSMASTTLWFTVAAYTLAAGAAFAAADPLASWLLGGADMAGALRIGIAMIAVNGIFYLTQSQLRFALRSGAYAVLSLVYSVAIVGLGVLLGYGFGLGLIGVLWGQFAGTAVGAALGLWLLRSTYRFYWEGRLLRTMLAFSLPLVPSGFATFLTVYSNRLLLNELQGLDAVGLFGVAARIAGAIGLLIIGLQTALTPLIYSHYKEPETPRQLGRLVEHFTAAALTCCLALGIFAWEILAFFTEQRYVPAAPLVLLLAPATLLAQMYIFFPGIAIMKRTHLQLYIFAATAVATLVLNWLLIGAAGLMGAAIATLAASILFIGLWIQASQRLYRLPVNWTAVAVACVLFGGAATAGLWVEALALPLGWKLAAKAAVLSLFAVSTLACGLIRPADAAWLFRRITGIAAMPGPTEKVSSRKKKRN